MRDAAQTRVVLSITLLLLDFLVISIGTVCDSANLDGHAGLWFGDDGSIFSIFLMRTSFWSNLPHLSASVP